MATGQDISVPARSTIITSSRGKTLAYLAVSLIFVAMGAFMLGDPSQATMAWLCIVFFGLGVVAFIWLLIRPQTLTLDAEGFTLGGGMVRSPKTIPWRDVQGFFVYKLPKGGKMIGYNFAPGARKDTTIARLARGFGADGALPRAWPQSPEKMAETLNAYRARALAGGR
jgi:hypothetical protein